MSEVSNGYMRAWKHGEPIANIHQVGQEIDPLRFDQEF